ncbi:hypothetical protein [Primorskyibacter marinus]|uniref:hypothetical protein n=1 Tax=Primorskyibacter marinus TaxID=1977320 RepID=UPI000E3026AE|nr:hypothetical protein [Primorskyibacter marinus]
MPKISMQVATRRRPVEKLFAEADGSSFSGALTKFLSAVRRSTASASSHVHGANAVCKTEYRDPYPADQLALRSSDDDCIMPLPRVRKQTCFAGCAAQNIAFRQRLINLRA